MNASITVNVELPGDLIGQDPEKLSSELRQLWAVEQVRRRRLGVGRAAEIARMPQATFMQLLGEHGVPVIDYPVDELEEELKQFGAG